MKKWVLRAVLKEEAESVFEAKCYKQTHQCKKTIFHQTFHQMFHQTFHKMFHQAAVEVTD